MFDVVWQQAFIDIEQHYHTGLFTSVLDDVYIEINIHYIYQ